MALVNCPECGRADVSDVAISCPHCGYPIKSHFERIYAEEEKRRKEDARISTEKELGMEDSFYKIGSFEKRADWKQKARERAKKQAKRKLFFIGCLVVVAAILVLAIILFGVSRGHDQYSEDSAIEQTASFDEIETPKADSNTEESNLSHNIDSDLQGKWISNDGKYCVVISGNTCRYGVVNADDAVELITDRNYEVNEQDQTISYVDEGYVEPPIRYYSYEGDGLYLCTDTDSKKFHKSTSEDKHNISEEIQGKWISFDIGDGRYHLLDFNGDTYLYTYIDTERGTDEVVSKGTYTIDEEMHTFSFNPEDRFVPGIDYYTFANGEIYLRAFHSSDSAFSKGDDPSDAKSAEELLGSRYDQSSTQAEASTSYSTSETQHSSGGSDNWNKVEGDERTLCWTIAKEAVKNQLKSPSSAKFPFSAISDGVTIVRLGDEYTVLSWVEADNSFGANIRSNFGVGLKKNGDMDFTVTSCEIW